MKRHRFPKHIERLRFSDREAWLAARGKDITASVVGALFGVHEYSSPYELWAAKSGNLPKQEMNHSALERGEMLEPVAVRMMRRRRPEWKINHNTGPKTIYFRDAKNRIGATPDTLVICPDRGPGTVQIKSVEQSIYRRKWTPDGGEPEPPTWIAMQALLEAHMTGSRWAAVAPLVIGYGIDLPIIEVPLVESVVPAIIRKTTEFWTLIETGQEPPPDYSRDRAVIEAMNPVDDGGEIDLVSNRRIYALIEERADLKLAAKVNDDRVDEIDAELKHTMKGAALAYLPNDMRMTWRTQRRMGVDGRINTVRVLRVPRPKDRVMGSPAPASTPSERRKRNDNEPWDF